MWPPKTATPTKSGHSCFFGSLADQVDRVAAVLRQNLSSMTLSVPLALHIPHSDPFSIANPSASPCPVGSIYQSGNIPHELWW